MAGHGDYATQVWRLALVQAQGVLRMMRHPVIAAVALPRGAALAAGGLSLATRPSSLLHPSTVLPSITHTHVGAEPSAETGRDHTVRMPFTCVAINPPITQAAQSFSQATRTRLGVIEFYTAFLRPFPRYEAAQAARGGDTPSEPGQPANVSLAYIAARRARRLSAEVCPRRPVLPLPSGSIVRA